MKGIKVKKSIAQKRINELRKKCMIDDDYKIKTVQGGVVIPIRKEYWKELRGITYSFQKRRKLEEFHEILKRILTKDELKKVKTAYDTVGTIAVLEIDDELRHKEKDIAGALLASKPNLTTVVRKDTGHEGELRIQKMKHLAGENTFMAEHIENGCAFSFDISKTYFSVRLSHERKRIIKQVKPGEDVLVMFSGIGPYAIEIAKHTKAKSVVAVELNKYAHEMAQINIVKNKVSNVLAIQGDVRVVVPDLKKSFDRIIMPLPKSAEDFLPCALLAANPKSTIHFYDFQKESSFNMSAKKIKKACSECKRKCRILRTVRCGQSAPREFRICVDFQVS